MTFTASLFRTKMRFQNRYILTLLLAAGSFLRAGAQEIYSLRRALQTAQKNNPALKAEALNIGMAQSDIVTAGLRPNPVLNSQTLQLVQPAHFSAHTEWWNAQNRQVWWQLTKPLQIAGQRRYKLEVARKNADVAANSYGEAQRSLLAAVAAKWLEAWTAQKQLDIMLLAKSNIDSMVYTNKIRYKNQVITQTDLFRTELMAKQYDIQYRSALQESQNRNKELRLLLGITDDLAVDTGDVLIFSRDINTDSLLSLSLSHRSDLLAARSLIDAGNSNIRLQKSLAYPQPEVGLIWNPQNTIRYFGLYATIDLPFFNRNQGEIRKSYMMQEQAEQQLTAVQQQIVTEISVTQENYRLQQRNIADFQPLLQQSQLILDNVKYNYSRGGTTIIDFLEAQRSWLETQQEYYNTLQQYRNSCIQLFYVTGLIHQLAQ